MSNTNKRREITQIWYDKVEPMEFLNLVFDGVVPFDYELWHKAAQEVSDAGLLKEIQD